MDLNKKNETTEEEEMVGVGLFLEEDVKQEPIYHPEIESNTSYFSANNDPLDIKSEDFLIIEHVSKNKEKRQGVDFFANNDPLNIKSEDVDVVVENGLKIVPKTRKFTNDNMRGEIIEAIDTIKEENDSALMGENSTTTSGSVTSHGNIIDTYKKCEKCAFQSKHKGRLKQHILNVHENHTQLKKFSCKECSYKTNNKCTFGRHWVLVHSLLANSKEEKKEYKCRSCEYKTKTRWSLEAHSRVHKTPSELTMDKCPLCPYQSKHPSGVANHMMRHKTPSETPMFKCELCPYESKWLHCLRNHIKVHEKKSEHPPIRKCESCEFTTNNKYSLEIHMKLHKIPAEKSKETFKCYTCEYQTNAKCQLVRHMLTHKPVWQLELVECAVCGFRSKTKKYLRDHILFKHGPMKNIKVNPSLYSIDS